MYSFLNNIFLCRILPLLLDPLIFFLEIQYKCYFVACAEQCAEK